MRKIVGRTMVALPFVVLFLFIAAKEGLGPASAIFGFTALVSGFIALGTYLATQ
jgi:hypothetical protein